jgi:hypothetical protein
MTQKAILVVIISLISCHIQNIYAGIEPSKNTSAIIRKDENKNNFTIQTSVIDINSDAIITVDEKHKKNISDTKTIDLPKESSEIKKTEKNRFESKKNNVVKKNNLKIEITKDDDGSKANLKTDGLAVTSMILGISSIVFFPFFIFFPLFILAPFLAIIFGTIGMSRILRKKRKGLGFAITGLICGLIGSVLITSILIAFSMGI